MATFSFTPHHRSSGSSGIYHIITASELKSLLRRSGSISWSWKTHRRLQQRCQRQQDSNPRTEQDLDDEGDSRRLSQNTGIFHPSISSLVALALKLRPNKRLIYLWINLFFDIYLCNLYRDI
jgi:hypothetical protein